MPTLQTQTQAQAHTPTPQAPVLPQSQVPPAFSPPTAPGTAYTPVPTTVPGATPTPAPAPLPTPYPYAPYGYPQQPYPQAAIPPAAYPHAPYYPPPVPPTTSHAHTHPTPSPYAYPGYPGYPPPAGYPIPPPPPPQEDLPSYEDMLVEALMDMDEQEGAAPRDLYIWMAQRWPLQTNFRPSASQALQKAFKRGRFEKMEGGKYRLSPNWEGGAVSGCVMCIYALYAMFADTLPFCYESRRRSAQHAARRRLRRRRTRSITHRRRPLLRSPTHRWRAGHPPPPHRRPRRTRDTRTRTGTLRIQAIRDTRRILMLPARTRLQAKLLPRMRPLRPRANRRRRL